MLEMFIVFGVNIGNLGRISGDREPMEEWTLEINKKLGQPSSTKIVDWYGHTDNFVVESSAIDRSEVANELTPVVGASCAVLSYYEAVAFVSIAEKVVSPASLEGRRWTSGIVFAVRSQPCRSVPKPTSHAVFFPINDYAVGAWKEGQLIEGGTLDRERRGDGWGAVSDDVSRTVGGVWTARSLRTIRGTLKKARHHPPRSCEQFSRDREKMPQGA